MKPVQLAPYNITKGNTYKETFVFQEREGKVVTPIDLTTYLNIQQDIRKGISINSELLYSCELGEEIIISGEDNNVLTITISNEEIENWKGGIYYRDIKFTNDLGEIYTYAEGKLIIRQNITE